MHSTLYWDADPLFGSTGAQDSKFCTSADKAAARSSIRSYADSQIPVCPFSPSLSQKLWPLLLSATATLTVQWPIPIAETASKLHSMAEQLNGWWQGSRSLHQPGRCCPSSASGGRLVKGRCQAGAAEVSCVQQLGCGLTAESGNLAVAPGAGLEAADQSIEKMSWPFDLPSQ